MRMTFACAAFVGALVLFLGNVADGGDKKGKEVTVTGKITCAKCDLGIEQKCTTVIVTKKDGKDVVIYLDPASGKKNHSAICQAGKDGSVTGTISEKDGKKVINAKAVKFE